MDSHTRILDTLAKLAETVPGHYRGRLAAALVYRNEFLSFGINQMKSHPFQSKFSSTKEAIYLHAETDAIRHALKKYDLKTVAKSRLYICRVKHEDANSPDLIWGLSKPCAGCQRAIATFNIEHVCYTTEDGGYDWL